MAIGDYVTTYEIEHRTSAGEWVPEGIECDTYEEALEELKFAPGQPKEKYRIVEVRGRVIWEAPKNK